MAKILTEMQCHRVKALNRQFNTYAERGWMCEGSDRYGLCNAIFNNDTDEIFWADYNGNILEGEIKSESLADIREMARIQGNIAKVCRQ